MMEQIYNEQFYHNRGIRANKRVVYDNLPGYDHCALIFNR
jgi:hypothetical protein